LTRLFQPRWRDHLHPKSHKSYTMCARTERKEQLDSVRAARAEERVTCSMFCTQREETRGKQLVANNKHLSVGLARTKDIRFVYGNFGRPITKYTVKYGVYIYGSGQPYLLVLRALLIEWGGGQHCTTCFADHGQSSSYVILRDTYSYNTL